MSAKPWSVGTAYCFGVLLTVSPVLTACGAGGTAAATATPAAPVALTIPGIVRYYPFDKSAADASGNRIDGQLHGATLAPDRFGIADQAYYFDGVDDSIAFDPSGLPSGSSPRTISAWILAESYQPELFPGLGARATVVGWGMSDWDGLSEMQIVEGRLQFHTYGSDRTSSAGLELHRWTHLAIVFGDGTVSLYIDGVLDSRDEASIDTGIGPGRIGAYPDPSYGFDQSYFHGALDDIAVFDRPLSDEQVRLLYAEGGWDQIPR